MNLVLDVCFYFSADMKKSRSENSTIYYEIISFELIHPYNQDTLNVPQIVKLGDSYKRLQYITNI